VAKKTDKSKTKKAKAKDDNVVSLTIVPSKPDAKRMIKELIEQGCIDWHSHALKRMHKKDISDVNVLNCLLKGAIVEDPYAVNDHGGGYRSVVERGVAGSWLRVVFQLQYEQSLLVVTAIDE